MKNDEKKKCCLGCAEFKVRYINDYPLGGCVVMDLMGQDIVRPLEEVCPYFRRG